MSSDTEFMETQRTKLNYIFYLQTKENVDSSFMQLSEILNKLNISLLPILPEELKTLDKATKNHVIYIRNDLSSAHLFNQLRKSFFDLALLSGKIHLYDISSFSEIDSSQKYIGKNVYRFIPLPTSLKQVAMTIAVDYFQDRNTEVEWPGGRRAKLPSMNTQN